MLEVQVYEVYYVNLWTKIDGKYIDIDLTSLTLEFFIGDRCIGI